MCLLSKKMVMFNSVVSSFLCYAITPPIYKSILMFLWLRRDGSDMFALTPSHDIIIGSQENRRKPSYRHVLYIYSFIISSNVASRSQSHRHKQTIHVASRCLWDSYLNRWIVKSWGIATHSLGSPGLQNSIVG